RRRIRLVPGLTAGGLPADLAGRLVEGRDERGVAAVTTDDQEVAIRDRRSSVAVLRVVRQPGLPDDRPGGRERGGTIRAEVHVDPVAFDDWCRRGKRVLGIQRIGVSGAEDFRVDEL